MSLRPVARRERVAVHEPLGQTNDADLEAAGELNGRCGAERDLHAAAADVDHHRAGAADVDAVDGRLMDEARLLGARRSREAGSRCRARSARGTRHRFAPRAWRSSPPRGSCRRSCDSASRLNFESAWSAAVIASGVSALAVEAAGAEPDHHFLTVDHLE